MNLPARLMNIVTLYAILSGLVCPEMHAQDKNVIDTVNLILQNKKGVEVITSDLNALGNDYLNKNEMENATWVMNEFMKYSKENQHYYGMYDAYALAGSIALRNNDKSTARMLADEWLKHAAKRNHDYGINGSYYLLAKILYTRRERWIPQLLFQKKFSKHRMSSYDSVYFPKVQFVVGKCVV